MLLLLEGAFSRRFSLISCTRSSTANISAACCALLGIPDDADSEICVCSTVPVAREPVGYGSCWRSSSRRQSPPLVVVVVNAVCIVDDLNNGILTWLLSTCVCTRFSMGSGCYDYCDSPEKK